MIPLRVSHLAKTFVAQKWFLSEKSFIDVVKDISFEVQEKEIVGLLGTNGAGKTTTIQMLLGALTPSAGTIEYFGRDFSIEGPQALQNVTHASGYDKLPANLTVGDNLDILGRFYGLSSYERSTRIKELLSRFGMTSFYNKRTGTLSAGQMTRVVLIKAFMPRPRLILLDEPTASLDPEVANEVRDFIAEQRTSDGVSVLFTSHNMMEVTNLCDRVLMMKEGRIIADDSPTNLAASIKKARLHLTISEGMEYALEYAARYNLLAHQEPHGIELEVDEQKVAETLIALTRQGVTYTTLSIDKPSLEDYFLSTAQIRERPR